MKFVDILRYVADRFDSPPDPVIEPDIEIPELPAGSTILFNTVNNAQVPGQSGSQFIRREVVYRDADGAKHKITLKNNVRAEGCGHNMTSPGDIGFFSVTSGKPVCKACEREYRRMRNQTRDEECVCRHVVAPHELTYIEGNGFVCEECEKKIKALKPLKAAGWLIGLFLKPLIIEEPEPGNEVPYETTEFPPHQPLPPVHYYPPPWPGHGAPHQAPYGLDRGRPERPDHSQ